MAAKIIAKTDETRRHRESISLLVETRRVYRKLDDPISMATLEGAPQKRRRLLWKGPEDNDVRPPMATDRPAPCTHPTSYAQAWKARRQSYSRNEDILDLLYLKEHEWLVGCTSTGDVVVWAVDDETLDGDDLLVGSPSSWKTSPILRQSISSKFPLRTLAEFPNENSKLLVGGNQGAWILTMPTTATGPITISPLYMELRCGVEQILTSGAEIFIRGSDGMVEHHNTNDEHQRIARIPIPEGQGASSMAVVQHPGDNDSSSANMLLIGTTMCQLLIHSISVSPGRSTLPKEIINLAPSSGASSNDRLPYGIAITSICGSRNGEWWTIAGTCCTGRDRPLIATLHGPTRTVVCHQETREKIQNILASPTFHRIYSVANESVITIWEAPYRLEASSRHRIWANMPSGRALCRVGGGHAPMVAVAGVGCLVDLLQGECRTQSLTSLATD